jgi:hypothetical protein
LEKENYPRSSSPPIPYIHDRVEHPFAFMEMSLGGIYNCCIGLVRNAHQIGMLNLAYNLCRCIQLLRDRSAAAVLC